MATLCTFWAFGPHCTETIISCAWTKRMRLIRLLQRVISSHWRADFDSPKNGHASLISAATSTPFYCINWPCLPFTKARYRWKTSTVSPARRELTVICGPAQHSMDSKLICPLESMKPSTTRDLFKHHEHGSLNVPIEHHPTIRYMVYNGYYCPIFPKWDIYQPLMNSERCIKSYQINILPTCFVWFILFRHGPFNANPAFSVVVVMMLSSSVRNEGKKANSKWIREILSTFNNTGWWMKTHVAIVTRTFKISWIVVDFNQSKGPGNPQTEYRIV